MTPFCNHDVTEGVHPDSRDVWLKGFIGHYGEVGVVHALVVDILSDEQQDIGVPVHAIYDCALGVALRWNLIIYQFTCNF